MDSEFSEDGRERAVMGNTKGAGSTFPAPVRRENGSNDNTKIGELGKEEVETRWREARAGAC